MKGLSDAVMHIHFLGIPTEPTNLLDNPESISKKDGTIAVGFHHDIKLENVLVFGGEVIEDRIMKIGDFGAARIDISSTVPDSAKGSGRQGTLTNEPPDFKMGGYAFRPYDIWSLGCVFLEFVGWALTPYEDALEHFASGRLNSSREDYISDDRF